MRFSPSLLRMVESLCRRAGHTTAALRGAVAQGALLVCPTLEQAKDLRRRYEVDTTYPGVTVERVAGLHKPVVFDAEVVKGMASEILALYDVIDTIERVASKNGAITHETLQMHLNGEGLYGVKDPRR